MHEAQLNDDHLHISWEYMEIREAILMAINEAELNATFLYRA